VKEEKVEEKEEDVKMAAEEITFDGAENVGEQAPDPEIESALRGEDSVKAASEKKSETRKAGVKSLGGQPRLASEGVVGDLSSLWDGAPDLKSLFHG
jgi:hypothetical protein